ADGFQVSLAADGLDAFEELQNGPRPALILLDLMMPRMDGEQFMKQMRTSSYADIPVVIMSGHTAAEKKTEELKAAFCLLKPIGIDELLRTVRQFALSGVRNDVA